MIFYREFSLAAQFESLLLDHQMITFRKLVATLGLNQPQLINETVRRGKPALEWLGEFYPNFGDLYERCSAEALREVMA